MDGFWLTNPLQLFKLEIVPTGDMTTAQKLNALTRLILFITLLLLLIWRRENHWWKFLLCGMIIVIVMYLSVRSVDEEFVAI